MAHDHSMLIYLKAITDDRPLLADWRLPHPALLPLRGRAGWAVEIQSHPGSGEPDRSHHMADTPPEYSWAYGEARDACS